jgi:hypothetical protein
MFARKACAYLSEESFKWSTLRQAPSLPQNIRKNGKTGEGETLNSIKAFVNYGSKKFYNIGPRGFGVSLLNNIL